VPIVNGADFYDEEQVFAYYMQRRQRPDSPNDTIETPIFMEMLGDYAGKAVLDLGCGDGRFGGELLAGGCHAYTGIEASVRMVALAQERLMPIGGTVYHESIESWVYPENAFDLVVSRLALHYTDHIEHTFARIFAALKPGGRLVFSVEHPVLTSSNQSATASGRRYEWIVDDYFITGARNVAWMGSEVIKFHRTVEDYFSALQEAGFTVELLRESRPRRKNFTDPDLYDRRTRIPLFLFLAARKLA
jgi:SAM-dependent methyltransferase